MTDPTLPLPVAQLWRRSVNSKSDKEAHDTAYYAWELSVRLAVLCRGSGESALPINGSVGDWVRVLSASEDQVEEPGLLETFQLFKREGFGDESVPRIVSPHRLLGALPAYRNRVVAHGSVRASSYYYEAGRILYRGVAAAWRCGLFAAEAGRLLYVRRVGGEPSETQVVELSGERSGIRRDCPEFPKDISIQPLCLYWVHSGVWKSLYPWCVFDEEAGRVYSLYGFRRRPEYLDYSTGEFLRGEELRKRFPVVIDDLEELAASGSIERGRGLGLPREEEYEILGRLGRGGMAKVDLARQKSLDRLVVLKSLLATKLGDELAVARFRREIAALGRCEHPNVIKIFASGERAGQSYYAMEFVEGADLQRIRSRPEFPSSFGDAIAGASSELRREQHDFFPDAADEEVSSPSGETDDKKRLVELARFFAGAARGVQHLHDNGIIHRDLSPANIMATAREGRAVVMDLGLASLEDVSKTLSHSEDRIQGTLRYIAPEQLLGNRIAMSRRVDIYSLGAVLYELISNRPLFDGDTSLRLEEQVKSEEPKPLTRVGARVPEDLATIVHKALEKDPLLRYESAKAFAEDLDNFAEGRPIVASPPTLAYVLRKWASRNRALASALVALLVVVLSAGFVVAWLQSEARRRTQRTLDQRLAAAYVEEADELWPIHPSMISAMGEWLKNVRELLTRSRFYREELEELRKMALPVDPEEEVRAKEADPRRYELKRIGYLLDAFSKTREEQLLDFEDADVLEPDERENLEASLEILKREIPSLQSAYDILSEEFEWRRFWQYKSIEEDREHEIRKAFDENLWKLSNEKTGLLEAIQRRRNLAMDLAKISIEGEANRDNWDSAIASIRDECPNYDGFELKPQLGLVPLEKNSKGLWEFWHVLSGEKPEKNDEGNWRIRPETGIVFVLIPGGDYWIGAQSESPNLPNFFDGCDVSETPLKAVRLDPYFISKYEMTQAQWGRTSEDVPSKRRAGFHYGGPRVSATHPVEFVSWEECTRNLSRSGLEIPTEAQWEVAARAGLEGPFPKPLREFAHHKYRGNQSEVHIPVDSLASNGFGLFNALGNVGEWCRDWFDEDGYFGSPSPRDGGLEPRMPYLKAFRGGCFAYVAIDVRFSKRFGEMPDYRDEMVGVRPSRPVE